jgi:hypothetical protein
MNLYRALCVASIVWLIFMEGCDSGSKVDLDHLTVTLSPSAATIPASGQVTLQATVEGSPEASSLLWFIAELQTDGASGAQCNCAGAMPPAGPCPDGTIQGIVPGSLTVLTLLPAPRVTFHVVAEYSLPFSTFVKDGKTVITVSP